MSTNYQSYDFVKDINFHIDNKLPINLTEKSQIFRSYLFRLKLFQLNERIKKNHPIFQEEYFLYNKNNVIFVARKEYDDSFKSIEIVNGIRIIRKMKLKKLFYSNYNP